MESIASRCTCGRRDLTPSGKLPLARGSEGPLEARVIKGVVAGVAAGSSSEGVVTDTPLPRAAEFTQRVRE
jgi:hypothetical protein